MNVKCVSRKKFHWKEIPVSFHGAEKDFTGELLHSNKICELIANNLDLNPLRSNPNIIQFFNFFTNYSCFYDFFLKFYKLFVIFSQILLVSHYIVLIS